MAAVVGIRREDKNQWERRVPLTPADVAALVREHGLRFQVEASPIRVFADADYRQAGAEVTTDIGAADVVLAVKEIPSHLLQRERVYVYFAHVIKGQSYNMPMLAHLLDLRATLLDYEKITDDTGRRLIFFSVHAGYAGTIDTLWALGRRLKTLGRTTPLLEIRRAFEYASLAEARGHLVSVGDRLRSDGLGAERPLVIGIAGYGNVARGCHEILAQIPAPAVTPAALLRGELPDAPLVKVEFREEHMAEPLAPGAAFDLQEYYQHPERYRGVFETYLPHLDVLLNTIYWEPRYPRLVASEWARRTYGAGRRPRLQVIGDISCDIEGAVELTVTATMPDEPCYVWDPPTGRPEFGCEGDGPVIMAVDNLPCELPRESSEYFSAVLRDLVPSLAACDFARPFGELDLPGPLHRAVICHRGELAPRYRYLEAFLQRSRA
ncbi:MAG: hypothetical protein R6X25_04330 [Candidatus Krumholzibacteriia bacterium]